MKKQLPKRSEVEVKYTWNINHLYETEKDYEEALADVLAKVDVYVEKYKGKLNSAKTINESLDDMRELQETFVVLGSYAQLQTSTDSLSEQNQMRMGMFGLKMQDVNQKLLFQSVELNACPLEILEEAKAQSVENANYLQELIDDRPHILSPDAEKAIVTLSQTLNAAYPNYQRFKLADMSFPDFEVDGVKHPNSFTLFENEWEYEKDTELRRNAYESFYDVLAKYQNGLANNYQAHVLKEKAMSKLTNYDTVYDYLLRGQKVGKDMMDRQIDVIMEKLAPAMRRYAKLLQEIHGLDKMTYADLKIAVDPELEPKVSIDDAKTYILEGLSILGPEYLDIARRSFDERWTDFPQNAGKSTGGFCSSPYGKNSYILINWNGQMDEVMVLAHEIGHAGHFQYANTTQNIFNTRPSMYFIEAPSTTNELIMARHLIKKEEDPRLKRWILSVMISRTYYHNFVTHLLEAAYQRKVYDKVELGQPLSARVLNDLKLSVLKEFWGDAVEIPDYAGLTWMRQPHYFMGLYPYTYSAGLTVGTVVSDKIYKGELDPKEWIEVLKAGGTKKPLDLAKMVGVDLSTTKPLEDAIKFISDTIDEIEKLTNEL